MADLENKGEMKKAQNNWVKPDKIHFDHALPSSRLTSENQLSLKKKHINEK